MAFCVCVVSAVTSYTHIIFEPLDFIARLAALIPPPRINLTRYHGVFAPNSQHRALVTPGKRGKGNQSKHADEEAPNTPFERTAAMTGFCSCKTGIHAIRGINLCATPQARFQHRPLSHIPVLRGIRESLHITSKCVPNAAGR